MITHAEMKKSIAEFVPAAIKRAFESYMSYSEIVRDHKEYKDFSGHHSACKVAISHIELLLKLAKWAEVPEAVSSSGLSNEELEKLIVSAHEEYSANEMTE